MAFQHPAIVREARRWNRFETVREFSLCGLQAPPRGMTISPPPASSLPRGLTCPISVALRTRPHSSAFPTREPPASARAPRRGPDAIREVSDGLESYSPLLDRDLAEHCEFADLGRPCTLPRRGSRVRDVTTVRDACRELDPGSKEAVPTPSRRRTFLHSREPLTAALELHYPDLTIHPARCPRRPAL